MISIKDNKLRWTISAILALLILFGTYRSVFSLAAFLIMGLMLVFCDRESNLLQIFFVMPMANIFKLSPGVQSFFTVIMLVYVVLHLVLPRRSTLLVVLFAIYILLGQLFGDGFNLFRTIKLVCNLLFLSSTLNSNVRLSHKKIFFSYIIGNIVSSFISQMNSSFFKIESFVGTKELGGSMELDGVMRFSGLYADPNYYAIGMIVSICLLIILYHKDEINFLTLAVLTTPIISFLILTYSKSAVLMLVIVFFFLLYSLFHKKKYALAFVLIILVATVFFLAISGVISAFDVVISRIMEADTGEGIEMNNLTTGRFNIWISYIKYLISNMNSLIFGDGLNANLVNGRATHNTYLDILFHLGFVGGTLLFASLKSILHQSTKKRKKRITLNYSVFICVLIMYFFLSELFYFDPPFHIFLVIVTLDYSFEETDVDEYICLNLNNKKRVADYEKE